MNQNIKRTPKQNRSHKTFDQVLDAVLYILKNGGHGQMTTNHIAKQAGISIGALYQYFPDKQSIFAALHDRHVQEVHQRLTAIQDACKGLPFEDLLRAIVTDQIEMHLSDSEQYKLLASEIPQDADQVAAHSAYLRALLLLELEQRGELRVADSDLTSKLFILVTAIDAFVHSAAIYRPDNISISQAKDLAIKAVLLWWRS